MWYSGVKSYEKDKLTKKRNKIVQLKKYWATIDSRWSSLDFAHQDQTEIALSATLAGLHNHIWQLFYLRKVLTLFRWHFCWPLMKVILKTSVNLILTLCWRPHSKGWAVGLEPVVHSRVEQMHQDCDAYTAQEPASKENQTISELYFPNSPVVKHFQASDSPDCYLWVLVSEVQRKSKSQCNSWHNNQKVHVSTSSRGLCGSQCTDSSHSSPQTYCI